MEIGVGLNLSVCIFFCCKWGIVMDVGRRTRLEAAAVCQVPHLSSGD